MKNKFWVALAVVLALAGVGYAITVNPASNVTGDSVATAETIIYRDTKAQFQIDLMTTAEIQADTPGVKGLLVYNSTLNKMCVSTGTTVEGYALIDGGALTTCQ